MPDSFWCLWSRHRRGWLAVRAMVPRLVDLVGQTQTAVVHGQQEAFYLQFGIQLALDDADGVEQLGDTLQGKVLTLHGDDDRIGGRQRVHCDKSQRWRTVDDDIVVFPFHLRQQILEHPLAMLHIEHLYLCTHQVDVGRYDVQTVDVGGVDGIAYIGMVDDAFVERAVYFLDVNAQSARCIGLRVGIDYQHFLFQRGQRGCQIDGRRGLAHTAFLIGQSYDFSHILSCLRWLHASSRRNYSAKIQHFIGIFPQSPSFLT